MNGICTGTGINITIPLKFAGMFPWEFPCPGSICRFSLSKMNPGLHELLLLSHGALMLLVATTHHRSARAYVTRAYVTRENMILGIGVGCCLQHITAVKMAYRYHTKGAPLRRADALMRLHAYP